jgi:hypothetical protein
MSVHRRSSDPCELGDVLVGDGGRPLLAEEFAGGGEDRFAATGDAGVGGLGHGDIL